MPLSPDDVNALQLEDCVGMLKGVCTALSILQVAVPKARLAGGCEALRRDIENFLKGHLNAENPVTETPR